ncbi:hypothetical protein [Maribellus mangrovi]|uniref:hypothetical protein n=1 Tax=Maribellus mangrovi TaxID=3133146 RepID=UPI0030EC46E5
MKDITKMTDEEILMNCRNEKNWLAQLGYTSEEIEKMYEYKPYTEEIEEFLFFNNELDEMIFEPIFEEI